MKVTVVIPCYNGEEYVAEAIASVLSQTHANIECLIVDDASTDGSRAIVEALASHDSRIKQVLLEVNGGPPVARNRALAAATGEWVTFLDADDLYRPDRIERLLALAANTGAEIVVDNQDVTTYPSRAANFIAFEFLRGEVPVSISIELFLRNNSKPGRGLSAGYMKPMFLRSFIARHGLEFNPRYRSGEDFLFFSEALASGPKFFGTQYSGYIHRRRPNSVSRSGPAHLHAMSEQSDYLLSKYGERLSREAARYLLERKKLLVRSAQMHEFRFLIAERNFAKAVRLGVTHPRMFTALPHLAGRTIARLFERAKKRCEEC